MKNDTVLLHIISYDKFLNNYPTTSALSNTVAWPREAIGPLVCGYFKNLEIKIIILYRSLRPHTFVLKLVGRC